MRDNTEKYNEFQILREDVCHVRIYPDPILIKEAVHVENIDGK